MSGAFAPNILPPVSEPPPYRADVVIIGAGLAGIAAALEALDRGLSCVVLEGESAEGFGGLARWSFGGIFVVGSPEQRFSGVVDSVDLALGDWLTYGAIPQGDTWPRRWAEAYVGRCLDDVRGWLVKHSVRFFPVVHWVERGMSDVPGNSVPRFHMVWGTGESLVKKLRGHLESHPRRSQLQLCFGHKVTELSWTAGRVSGVAGVRVGDAAGEFRADGEAVIVAAGGIAGDLDMVRKHWNKRWGEPPEYLLNGSHPPADGKMHGAVEALGGQVTHLPNLWNYAAGVHHWKPKHPLHGLSLVPPKSALWVNWQGRRLGPPAMVTSYDTLHLVESVCSQQKKYSWQVLNWRIAKKELAVSGAEFNHAVRDKKLFKFLSHLVLGNPGLVREFIEHCPDFVTARSVPELVEKMNDLTGTDDVDADVLGAEVRAYDAAVARGPRFCNDDQLLRIAQARRYRGDRVRTCKFARIDDARARPLIAIREFILTRKSLGGIQTDLESRVLGGDGEPIPGLYAAGEAAGFGGGGVHGMRSLEGTFLGGCILTGRVAAQSIAAGK